MGGRRVLFQVFRVYRQGRWCLHADDVPALCDEIGVGVLTPAAVVQLVPHYARPTAMLLMKRLAELTLAGRDVAVRGQTLGIALRELQGIKTVCLRRESVPAFLKAVITQFDRRTELQAVQHRL